MSRKSKTRIRIPRALRGKVTLWEDTRQEEILSALEKTKRWQILDGCAPGDWQNIGICSPQTGQDEMSMKSNGELMKYTKPMSAIASLLVIFFTIVKSPAEMRTPSGHFSAAIAATLDADQMSRSSLFHNDPPKRTYIVRVIDESSKKPISGAKVWVDIGDPVTTKRNGYTDSGGTFRFVWDLIGTRTKARITVECSGYSTVEDVNVLIEDRMIQLSKLK